MASLALSLRKEWSLHPTNEPFSPTCMHIPSERQLFIGDSRGRIWYFTRAGHENDWKPAMMMDSSSRAPVVALDYGPVEGTNGTDLTYMVDQPFCRVPVLLSLDRSGHLSLWAASQDGRCLMQNATGLEPLGMVRSGAFLIVWGTSPGLSIFSTESLEPIQTVGQQSPLVAVVTLENGDACSPSLWVTKVLAFDSNLIWVLLDSGTVWEYEFCRDTGRIASVGHPVKGLPLGITQMERVDGRRAVLWAGQASLLSVYDVGSRSLKPLDLAEDLKAKLKDDPLQLLVALDGGRVILEIGPSEMIVLDCHTGHWEGLEAQGLVAANGRVALLRRQDGALAFWGVDGWKLPLTKGGESITACHVSANSLVACGMQSGVVRVSGIASFLSNPGHDDCVIQTDSGKPITAIALTDSVIVLGNVSGQLAFYHWPHKTEMGRFKNHTRAIISLLVLRNTVFAVAGDGSLSAYRASETGVALLGVFVRRHGVSLARLCWQGQSSNQRVLLEYTDLRLRLWNMDSGLLEEECVVGSPSADALLQSYSESMSIVAGASLSAQDSTSLRAAFSCVPGDPPRIDVNARDLATLLHQSSCAKEVREAAGAFVDLVMGAGSSTISVGLHGYPRHPPRWFLLDGFV